MKIHFAFFVFTLFLSFSLAEIEPRFPGEQPIVIANAPQPGATAPPPPPGQGGLADQVDLIQIDPYTFDTSPPVVVVLQADAPPQEVQFASDRDSSILGGERDIQYTVTDGAAGLVFSAGASGDTFTISTPNNGAGVVLLQYDGQDNSINLDTDSGLGGVDFSVGIGFRILARTDIDTDFVLNVADAFGNFGSVDNFVPGTPDTSESQSYFVNFADFPGNVDFSAINAIEFIVQARDNVDFILSTFVVFGTAIPPTDCITGVVLPCDTDYYRIATFDGVQIGDYLSISYDDVGEVDQFQNTEGRFYIQTSTYGNLQEELASNNIIKDTTGLLPGPSNYEYRCAGNCDVEIVWSQLENTTYYLAVEGHGDGQLVYQICLAYRSVPVIDLVDGSPETIFFDQRPTFPPRDNVLNYRFYTLDVPRSSFSEGTYLVVNVSRAEPFPGVGLRVMYESLPETAFDTGVIGAIDRNSQGRRVDDTIYNFCVDTSTVDRPDYDHPVASDPRVPCDCFTEQQLFGAGPAFQLTCQLVVDPCRFRYGRWYMSVELPERVAPGDPLDLSGQTNYTITATTVSPSITTLIRNVTFKAFVEPEAVAHFKLDVPANTVLEGDSHLLVHLSNVRNGIVDIFVHQGLGIGHNLAGGPEGCVPANATCRTCDACNVVIEKCHFTPGTWYISVGIARDDTGFLINDVDRLPITFTLRANWLQDETPQRLVAGVPVASYIGESLYDFYVIDVPPTIDTWLFIELFAKANNTEVVLAILHGDLPGGECYERPDFYCMTGDPYGKRWDSGTPAFLDNDPVQRESCTFMVQTCELTPGPLFISVYGHHTGYAAYGDTTFYQVPVHYTLWADFDVALSLQSGVSYSETVVQKQYQHYYIRADQVQQGSSLSVEITNIQHGIPQTLEAFVNYNYLAGNCPCYDHLYNCTGARPCDSSSLDARPDVETVLNCCTINVPASDFRPGVWYIAVLGINEDYFWTTTPIGYTLTATINEAPSFVPLILGQPYQGDVPQWNKTLEYVHFRLAAESVPLNDLVFKATFVQNCDFRGKHDDVRPNAVDTLWMYVNRGAPATEYLGGWVQRCRVDASTQSYCTVVIPHCEWEGDDWFVAIQGRYDADFVGRFTLRAFTDEVRDFQLTDGVSRYDRVFVGRHQHYFIETTAEEDQYLSIDLYTNQDQDFITVYLMRDERAGASPCFNSFASCISQTCCTWQLHACDLEPGRYYISVYGSHDQFYDTSVEYTLTASHKPVTTLLFNGDPFTGHLKQVGDVNHYRFEVPANVRIGTFLLFEVDNVKHGAVTAYGQSGFLAGRCPCFIWEHQCTASDDPFGPAGAEWCEIRVPSCQLQPGEYFFSVWAIDNQQPDPPVFVTPIGYTLEVNLITPVIIDPFVAVGRDVLNTEPFQFVANARYNHYEVSVDDDDFASGHHLIVEITSVQDGALFVYYNQFLPGDENSACHIAELCTSGLGAGAECYWQIPYCLARPLGTGNKHYITVEGRTGRVQASYNILIWKQGVPSYPANPLFTLDNGVSAGTNNQTELDVVHFVNHEPNGWTQFVRLLDVPARLDEGRGEVLEVFFYRITNNPGEDLSFDVFLHPNEPAGAHECCAADPSTLGSCQGAPCSNTADTTTSSSNGPDVFTHTCEFGTNTAVGHNGNGDPLFGERCTVRVWPCEFNKYCANETRDWFMSVVPRGNPNLNARGAGLQYSTQWRVRDLRLTEGQTVGSIDLTPSINTYEFTQTYSVVSETTESQGWLSFFVDFAERDNSRLSIQTLFTEGTGVVYINGDEFASMTQTCNDYTCGSSGDCAGDGRFYVTECCALKHDRYYITLRNTGAPGSRTSVQFRIVETIFPSVVEIEDHPTETLPFIATSGDSVYPGVTGVEGDNYDFYVLIIDDDDLDQRQSWVVDVTRPPQDSGVLDVYIRFGAPPGQFGPDNAQSFYGNADEGCHGWRYTCSLNLPDSRCLFQIPYCDLIEGFWWIAIHNPVFNFDSTVNDLPDYTLVTYISDPPLAVAVEEQVSSPSTADSGLLQHFSFNITEGDLDFDDRPDLEGYWTRYLRFQLDGVNPGSATMWVNYGALAGPNGQDNCLFSFAAVDCVDSCFVDITPCELDGSVIKLKTGVYYVSVRHSAGTPYSLVARVYRDIYTPLTLTETIVGSGNRLGVVDDLYSYTVTESELNTNGDGDGNYRYVIDIPGVDDDDLADNEYFVFNFTRVDDDDVADNDDGAAVHFEVWRDDCTRYLCDIAGPRTWCTIDALELAPCSAKAGRFFIRAVNPGGVTFTIDLYHNETVVQNIMDRQIITEIVYPYEYQEYFYDAVSVGEGAALSVRVCSICGDVEAFIRPDLPAGPVPDNTGYEKSCSIDYCRATAGVVDDTSFEQENNCCEIFLDTCQYEQRGYYIGIRGVTQVYPNDRNEHLYIPAKYTIQPAQYNVNVTDLHFASCAKTVNYYASWSDVPRQYAIDIESINVGAMLRFSMRLPGEFYATPQAPATLYVQANQTVGYSDGCPLDGPFDDALSCSTTTSCDFVIPYCKLMPYCGGRYFIWADAPRGTEIIVERWDPTVPIVHNDVQYHATINAPGPDVDFDTPFTPNRQIYRFDLDPKLYQDANYYEKFFVRVIFTNVAQGEIAFTVNSGHSPYVAGTDCAEPLFLDTSSCSSVGAGDECWVELEYATLLQLAGGEDCDIPKTYWLTVHGISQDCELHSVKYDFIVQTKWLLTYYPVGETICNTVEERQYNFHRLRHRAVENPQESILRIRIEDLDVNENVNLLINDGSLATSFQYHFNAPTTASQNLDLEYICGYDDLYMSVYGTESNDGEIDYKMSVEKVTVRVKDLMEDMVHYEDDDDDDACPTPHDFYRFRTAWPNGHHDGAFMRVLVDSEFPTQVYVNKGDFAWAGCADSGYGENDPAITGTTSVNVYDFCNFEDGSYFITVVADGPYYIYTDVRDDAQELTLGEVFRDELEPGMYRMYTLDICDEWTEADDRLVVEISDVDNGDVYGWIRHNGNAGDPTEFGYNTCSEGTAFADYGAGESGYDFLLVDHCDLKTGHYHILIRAAEHEGSPERDCEHVTFRLYPYLIDYQIDPVEIIPNTPITDSVDFWTVNRIVPDSTPFARYYGVHPLMEGEGFYEQISHAVTRLSNVEGGLLYLRVMCDHLAISEFAYIEGEIYGLVSNSADDFDFDPTHDGLISPANKMQSGRFPFNYQNVLDHRESELQPECNGCGDLCCQMTFDDLDQYIRDKSCAIWVPSCYLVWKHFYISVEPITQFAEDHSITYTLQFDHTRDYRLLQPDRNSVNSFTNDNWDYDFFYSISSEPQSMRWRVVVESGEGVLVTVRNHRCPLQATWVKEVWCDADYFDRPWMCDIEIPTRAAHPGDNAFFVAVYGKNATYSIAFWRGRENCHDFTGSGRTEGLDFCAGLVPYTTWRWDSYHNLDQEAKCFFEDLYQHFRVQPCYTGVTPECNATLAAFACHESFRKCDAEGFYTGTCRDSCEAVVYECANWFETVDLEHYNCTSSRYLDHNAQVCTGNPAFASFDTATENFLGAEPELLLFKSSPSSDSSSLLTGNIYLVTLVLAFFALVF